MFQAEYIVERVLAAREEGVDLKQQGGVVSFKLPQRSIRT